MDFFAPAKKLGQTPKHQRLTELADWLADVAPALDVCALRHGTGLPPGNNYGVVNYSYGGGLELSLADILNERNKADMEPLGSFLDIFDSELRTKSIKMSDFYNNSMLSKQNLSRIRTQVNKRGSAVGVVTRSVAFAAIVGLNTDIPTAKALLASCGFAFNLDDPLDLIVYYNIKKRAGFSMYEITSYAELLSTKST